MVVPWTHSRSLDGGKSTTDVPAKPISRGVEQIFTEATYLQNKSPSHGALDGLALASSSIPPSCKAGWKSLRNGRTRFSLSVRGCQLSGVCDNGRHCDGRGWNLRGAREGHRQQADEGQLAQSALGVCTGRRDWCLRWKQDPSVGGGHDKGHQRDAGRPQHATGDACRRLRVRNEHYRQQVRLIYGRGGGVLG